MAGAVAEQTMLQYFTARGRGMVVGAACVIGFVGTLSAQTADSTRCDSIVFASRQDSVRTALYVSVRTISAETSDEFRRHMATAIATVFTPPKPFRVSVFSGPSQMRTIRRLGAADETELRAPVVTGVYRLSTAQTDSVPRPEVLRASLVVGFDSAAVEAIRAAAALREIFQPPAGIPSMTIEARFATDSQPDAVKFVEAMFPRMPVVDAVPKAGNPRPKFPFGALEDETRRNDVVLSFVVDRTGVPALETVEVVRATSLLFLRAALEALPLQRFTPATVKGCAVAQLVSYPFVFVLP
jgi:hypothetical protein